MPRTATTAAPALPTTGQPTLPRRGRLRPAHLLPSLLTWTKGMAATWPMMAGNTQPGICCSFRRFRAAMPLRAPSNPTLHATPHSPHATRHATRHHSAAIRLIGPRVARQRLEQPVGRQRCDDQDDATPEHRFTMEICAWPSRQMFSSRWIL